MVVSTTEKKRVCVVGGGPAGLVALRRVQDSPNLTGTIFEQKDDIGGVWNYKGKKLFSTSHRNLTPGKKLEEDPESVTTMYDNLTCNLPYPLLEFLDFKHPKDQSTFPTQSTMHQYLKGYATRFNLWPNIKLNTAIVDISPENDNVREGEPGRWIVETHNHKENTFEKAIFDAVIICTGKNSYPLIPKIPGLETFEGKVVHVKYFKNADGYEGKNIVAIGLGPSMADFALNLSPIAKKITLCHKFPEGYKLGLLPANVRETKNVKLVTKNGVVTEDDEIIPCDIILLCTGYALKFPFMNPTSGFSVIEEKYVPHLYKMTVFTKRPTLFVLNMCYRSPEIVLVEVQARFAVSCLEGKYKLPTFEQMESELNADETEKKKLGHPYSIWFQVGEFGAGSWQYFLKMAEDIGIDTKTEYRHWPLLEKLYMTTVFRIFGKAVLYKKDVLQIVDDNTWAVTLHASPDYPESKAEIVKMILNPEEKTVTIETCDI